MVQFVALPYCWGQDQVEQEVEVVVVHQLEQCQQRFAIMVAKTVGEGIDSLGKDFSNLGANVLASLAEVTMTSMVQDIALQVEWMGAIEYWDNNIVEEIDYSYYSKK